MTPDQINQLAEKLLPRLNRTRTCQSFCRVVIRNVDKPLKRRVAYAAMKLMGKSWSEATMRGWLREKAHTKEAQAKRVAARRKQRGIRKTQAI